MPGEPQGIVPVTSKGSVRLHEIFASVTKRSLNACRIHVVSVLGHVVAVSRGSLPAYSCGRGVVTSNILIPNKMCKMPSSFLHRTCGPERGTWDLGRPRPAGPHPTPDVIRVSHCRIAAMQFPTGYNILVCLYTPHMLYNSRRTTQISCGITTIRSEL